MGLLLKLFACLVMLIVAIVVGIRRAMRVRGANTWPITDGKIEALSISKPDHGFHVKPWMGLMAYSYRIDGAIIREFTRLKP